MQTIFSGIQPSGTLTIGNYIGAMKHFVRLQEEGRCYYCIVDYHAISTASLDAQTLAQNVRSLAAMYLAVGLDPNRVTLFVQSDVSAHTELAWVMNCLAHMGELERMTQFKDKSKGKDSIPVGLFTYPPLMAADILLYDTTQVPVGDDQKQHLEVTRDWAERFNHRYGDVFVVPEAMISKVGSRIMSLDDPSTKMSKSNPNPGSYIALQDEPNVIVKKIKRAVTDSDNDIRFDPVQKPAVSNLLTIYALFTGKTVEDSVAHFSGQGYGQFKKEIAEAVVDTLQPIQEKYAYYVQSSELDDVLAQGAQRAEEHANHTLEKVKRALGVGRSGIGR